MQVTKASVSRVAQTHITLALHLYHQFAAALDLLLQNHQVLRFKENACQVATSAARCANWERAGNAFIYHLSGTGSPSHWFCLDWDGEPWINRLFADRLTQEVIDGSRSPRVRDNWLALPPPEHPIPLDAILGDAASKAGHLGV
jgi:hypothetical protein